MCSSIGKPPSHTPLTNIRKQLCLPPALIMGMGHGSTLLHRNTSIPWGGTHAWQSVRCAEAMSAGAEICSSWSLPFSRDTNKRHNPVHWVGIIRQATLQEVIIMGTPSVAEKRASEVCSWAKDLPGKLVGQHLWSLLQTCL